MATTTPNYGWPVPTSTDLVKDGATAIEALGDAIDATLFAASPGLTKISTTSFSAVSSQSINNVFSSTYDNYKIILNLDSTSSTSYDLVLRLRVGGSDLSTTVYTYGGIFAKNGNSSQVDYSAGGSGFNIGGDSAIGQGGQYFVEIGNPFRTTGKHTAYWQSFGVAGGQNAAVTYSAQVAAGTSYTGFSLVERFGGTITGSVSVYGYSK